ncbi:MAG: DUF115 domain-containing protein [Candidatus Omnitrophota bacterium]|nr:DUF115 domain-containing protein [Candidatus Omnitrophota bacterium]
MNIKFITKRFLFWILPYFLYVWLRKISKPIFNRSRILALVKPNSRFKDIHKGKRCFILCNGPSINKQNLLLLKDEIIFSVSSGYHHKDYAVIRPKYHCVPPVTYGLITKRDVSDWFKEMDSKVGDAEIFLNYSEEQLIKSRNLFQGRSLNYFFMNNSFRDYSVEAIDISKEIPSVQSVSIMCLIIAVYMGFEQIYLLGVEHDSFKTKEYKYFYKPTVLKNKDFMVVKNDDLFLKQEELFSYAVLWSQYRKIKEIAIKNSISIYNASLGGALDIFERVSFEEVASSGKNNENKG